METIKFALALVGVLAVAGAVFVYLRSKKTIDAAAYVRRRPLKSYEQTLYWRLAKTLSDHVILAQVMMNRCVAMKGPHASALARENLDFVICNRAMRILAVIEVDDETRALPDQRQKIERLKAEALEAAGIKLIKCSPNGLLSEGYIAMEFKNESVSRLAA